MLRSNPPARNPDSPQYWERFEIPIVQSQHHFLPDGDSEDPVTKEGTKTTPPVGK